VKPPAIEEVLARLRESFFQPHLAFGVDVKGRMLVWRDAISGETGHIAALEPETFDASVAAVIDELRVLRSGKVERKRPGRAERRVPYGDHERTQRRRARVRVVGH
jgi:hypothetical protein